VPRIALALCVVVLSLSGSAMSSVSAADNIISVDTTIPVTDNTGVYDLEKDPEDCIGFLPKPGCGKEPEQAGDRGGALQYSVFALMLVGLGIIGTVLVRNVIRRDRALAKHMKKSDN
jgi:hypothetical protein